MDRCDFPAFFVDWNIYFSFDNNIDVVFRKSRKSCRGYNLFCVRSVFLLLSFVTGFLGLILGYSEMG